MIANLLAQLSFDEKQCHLLEALADGSELAASTLCRRTGIARSTVYLQLSELEEMGLVEEIERSGVKYFSLRGPSVFAEMVRSQKEEISRREKTASQLEKLLKPTTT